MICFIYFKGKVLLKPECLKSRVDLLLQLSRFSLSLEGTVQILRKRLTSQLRALAAQVENAEIVRVNPHLREPTSICAASKDIL